MVKIEKPPPRPPSKRERLRILLEQIKNWQNEGMSPQEIAENKLTEKQWDFLVEQGFDVDSFILTDEQKADLKGMLKTARPVGMQYNKKYPKDKQEFYNNLVEFVKSQGGEVKKKERENFRDIEFRIAETEYKLVFSSPRKKKG